MGNKVQKLEEEINLMKENHVIQATKTMMGDRNRSQINRLGGSLLAK